jgi:hypothetical protein
VSAGGPGRPGRIATTVEALELFAASLAPTDRVVLARAERRPPDGSPARDRRSLRVTLPALT